MIELSKYTPGRRVWNVRNGLSGFALSPVAGGRVHVQYDGEFSATARDPEDFSFWPGDPMTPAQIELARHALGLDGRRRQTFRNHFVTGPGSTDFDEWEAMVTAGYARTSAGSPLSGGDPVFHLTRAGADRALLPGERLSPEDWPI